MSKDKESSFEGYMEFMGEQPKKLGIPEDVFWVAMLQSQNAVVGSAMYDKCMKVIEDNPQFFTWEAKYRSIPKEVHEAYAKERWDSYGVKKMPLFEEGVAKGDGLMARIKREYLVDLAAPKYEGKFTMKSFEDFFKSMREQEERIAKEKKQQKDIWDKHYKKYNLKYRP